MCTANKVAHQKLLWVTVIRTDPRISQSVRQWVIKPFWRSKWVDKRLISLIPSRFVSVNFKSSTQCVCWCVHSRASYCLCSTCNGIKVQSLRVFLWVCGAMLVILVTFNTHTYCTYTHTHSCQCWVCCSWNSGRHRVPMSKQIWSHTWTRRQNQSPYQFSVLFVLHLFYEKGNHVLSFHASRTMIDWCLSK